MCVAFVSVKIAGLFFSIVCWCSKFSWTEFVNFSHVYCQALFFFRVWYLKVEFIQPHLLIWQVSVLLSACKKWKRLQYPIAVNWPRKKVKNVSLRHYHLPALPAWIYRMKYIKTRKAIFSWNCHEVRKLFRFVS